MLLKILKFRGFFNGAGCVLSLPLSFRAAASAFWCGVGCVRGGVSLSLSVRGVVSSLPTHLSPPPRPPGAERHPPHITLEERDNPHQVFGSRYKCKHKYKHKHITLEERDNPQQVATDTKIQTHHSRDNPKHRQVWRQHNAKKCDSFYKGLLNTQCAEQMPSITCWGLNERYFLKMREREASHSMEGSLRHSSQVGRDVGKYIDNTFREASKLILRQGY